MSLLIRVKTLDGVWETVGQDRLKGVSAEGFNCSANGWGSDRAGFTLRRSVGLAWPDLVPFTPLEVEIDGIKVWAGYVSETPAQDGTEESLSVQCAGNQYYLDFDPFYRIYVHRTLADWRSAADVVTNDIANYWTLAGSVSSEDGATTFGWANDVFIKSGAAVGVTLDLGLGNVAEIIAATYDVVGAGGAHAGQIQAYARSHTTPAGAHGPAPTFYEIGWPAGNVALPQSIANLPASFSKAAGSNRYLTLFLYNSGGDFISTSDYVIKLKTAVIGGPVAVSGENMVGGTFSSLRASYVVKDVILNHWPFSKSLDRVADTTTAIPELAFRDATSARDVLKAANAFHDYTCGVDVDGQIYFWPRTTVGPSLVVGKWSGVELSDASFGSGEEVFNKVTIQAADQTGESIDRVFLSSEATINVACPSLDRRGLFRGTTLSISSAVDTSTVQTIARLFLTNHRKTTMKGSMTVRGHGAVRHFTGRGVPPAEILLHAGNRIRIEHKIDPDTGALGREATIASVSYTHEGRQVAIELDDRRDHLETFLQRLTATTAAG